MEEAQVAIVLDAKKRKLEQATTKAALKKVIPPPSRPDWDIGEDDAVHDPVLPSVEGADDEPTPTPRPGRKQVNPAGLSSPVPKGRTAVAPSTVSAKGKAAAGVPPKAQAVVATPPKAKAVVATPQKTKAGKVAAAAPPRAKAVAATSQRTAARYATVGDITVAAPGKPSLHGISFLDLVQPKAACDAKTRGAFTSRAYDTTKKRAASKFGADDFRVIETSRAAYKLASDVYTQACG